MANKPLIEIVPGKGLDSGIFPSVEAAAGAIWKTANNAWFRRSSLEHVLGRSRAVTMLGRPSKAMTQAYVSGVKRLYYEDLGIVFYWTGNGAPNVIGSLDQNGEYDLEPFGSWLVATDNISQLKLWKNTGTFIDIATGQFVSAKIIKKMAQRILAYSSDVYPAGFHWCSPSNPEAWTPGPGLGAGNLPLRDLDSDIMAVADLGGSHAVYSRESLLVVRYLGEALQFGVPTQALHGIGAPGKHAPVSLDRLNYGIFQGGVFVTDGSDFRTLDDPAINAWLREEVDWERGEEIVGYHDEYLKQIVWAVPLLSGARQGVLLDPKGNDIRLTPSFSYMDADFTAAAEREVFDTPFVALTDGIYSASLPTTVMGDFSLETHLLDAGDQSRYKQWDYLLAKGTIASGAEIRFGFTDQPDHDTVVWNDWQSLQYNTPFEPRESVFIAFQIRTSGPLKLSALHLYGALTGSVM